MARVCMSLLVLFGCITVACAEDKDSENEKPAPKLPGIAIDQKAGVVDVDAVFAARDAYLELIACTSGSKEHESLVAIKARAQHVHFALMLLGAQPGKPSQWVKDKKTGEWRGINATGTKVKVSLLIEEDGKWVERSITKYIIDRDDKPLPGEVFVFGGSKLTEKKDGSTVYEADTEGNAVSLVSFGDETLSWPTAASTSNDTLDYYVKTDALPPADAKVKLRLRPMVAKKKAKEG